MASNASIMALVSDASVLLTTPFNVWHFHTTGHQHAPSGVAVKTMYPPELLPDGTCRLAKDASLKQISCYYQDLKVYSQWLFFYFSQQFIGCKDILNFRIFHG